MIRTRSRIGERVYTTRRRPLYAYLVSALPEISWKERDGTREMTTDFIPFFLSFFFLSSCRSRSCVQNDTTCSLRGHFRCHVSYRLIRTAREQRHRRGLWNYFFKIMSHFRLSKRRCPFFFESEKRGRGGIARRTLTSTHWADFCTEFDRFFEFFLSVSHQYGNGEG